MDKWFCILAALTIIFGVSSVLIDLICDGIRHKLYLSVAFDIWCLALIDSVLVCFVWAQLP